jgi:predicted transcriptional regulator
MKHTPIQDQLRTALSAHVGEHNRIARETGVPQATVSRIHLGKVSPRLSTAQPLLDWFAKNSSGRRKSAPRLANASRRVDAGASAPAPAPLGQ